MADNKQQQHREKLKQTPKKGVAEALSAKKTQEDLREYSKAGEMMATNENLEAADKIRTLKGSDRLPPPSSIETDPNAARHWDKITVFSMAMGGIIAKLKKKGVSVERFRKSPHLLRSAVRIHGIQSQLTIPERVAIENLDSILGEPGETSHFLLQEGTWGDIVDEGEAAVSSLARVKNFVRKHPAGTVGIVLAGAAGLYIFGSVFKGLWGKIRGKGKEKGGESNRSWFKKEVLIPVGLFLFGLLMGKNALKKLMGDMSLKDLIGLRKKGGMLPDKAREELEKRIAQLEKAQTLAKDTAGKAKGAIVAGAGTVKDAMSGAADAVKEEVENEQTQRIAAEKLFVNIFFYHKEFKDIKGDLEWAIVNMYSKKLSKLKEVYSKYKNEKEIPHSALGVRQGKVSKKHLFLLVGKILEVQKQLKLKDSENVESLFTKMIKDPVFKMHNTIHSDVLDKLKDGDIDDAIVALGTSGLGDKILGKRDSFLDKMDENLNLTEGLNDKQKKAFRKLQIMLFASGKRMDGNAKSTIKAILARKNIDDVDSVVIERAEQFFDTIKNKTKDLLPHIKTRFQIKKLGGVPIKNHLAEGLTLDNIKFSNALQLVVISDGINWSSNDKNTVHWMKDLVLLNAIIRSLPNNMRNEYLTVLTKAIATSETMNINIPGLESLMPYLNKLKEFIVNKSVEKGHGIIQGAAYLRDTKPSEAENFAQLAKESPFMSFGDEAVGGTIEVGTDALAAIVSILGVTPEQLGGTKTAEELLHLLSHKISLREDGSSMMYDLNNPTSVVVNIGWKYFVLKPKGIISEALKSVSDGDFGGAAKVWAVGSAPFVTLGILKGGIWDRSIHTLTRWGRGKAILKGAVKGFMYPAYAPYLVAKTGLRATKGIATVAIATKEYARRPFMYGGEVARWGVDKIRLRKVFYPGQNIQTMMNNGDLFSRYLKDAPRAGLSIKEKWDLFKTDKLSILKRLGGNFNENMALKYAGRFAKRYNDFFLFGKDGGRLLADKITTQSISEVQAAYNRMNNFMKSYGAGAYDDMFKQIAELVKKGDKGGKLIGDIETLLKGQTGMGCLLDSEATALAKQFKTEEDFTRFLTRMGDGKKYMEARRAGLLSKLFKPSSIDDVLKSAGNDLTKAQKKVADSISKLEEARRTGKGIKSAEKALEKAKKVEDAIKNKITDLEVKKGFASTAETSHALDKAGDVLKSARSDLKGIEKKVTDTSTKLKKARKTGKGIEKAEEAFNNARKAQIDLRISISQLKRIQNIEKQIEEAKQAGKATKTIRKFLANLKKAKDAAATSLDTAQESARAIQHVGKLAKFGRFMGRAVPLAFAAVSVYEAGTSAYEAFTTDVEGRAAISGGRAAMWTANAAADVAAVAVGVGAKGAAGVAGRLWIPLIPVTYAGTEIFNTIYEGTLTTSEWAQKYSYDELVHQWFTTCNSVSLGDAWVTGFSSFASLEHDKEVDKSMAEKLNSAHKVYKYMVTAQKNPGVMSILGSSEPSKSKSSKVEAEIDKTYTKYHEYYFRHNSIERIHNYGSAQQYVAEAQLFDEIMQMRDTEKARGRTALMMGNENLLSDRFEITGTASEPKAKKMFLPTVLVKKYKESMIKDMKKNMLPEAFANMESMETPYLLRLCVQIYNKMADTSKFEDDRELAQNLTNSLLGIKNFLTYKRGINFSIAIRKYDFSKPEMSLEEIVKHLENFSIANSPSYKNFEKKIADPSPGVHAVYRLAQYFGYGGNAKEKDIKQYLNSDSASYHGVYWDGDEWTVRERGFELDDEVGPNLNKSTVGEMVKLLRENPDNILEHRHDTVFVDSYDYTSQVTKMANILENGYEEGVRKYESVPREMYADIVA